jgi:hypothetical protein
MVCMPRLVFASALCSLIAVSTFEVRAAELVMLGEAGCSHCEQWNEEIGVVYHKTAEGQRLPLRRVDIHDPLPEDLTYLVKGGYTPTFVLVDKGREVGRIRGYPGEDFFWGLLGQLIKRLPPDAVDNRRIN